MKIVAIPFLTLLIATGSHASTYMTATIDGSFADWAGVPVLHTDVAEGGAVTIDFTNIYAANDDDYLYIRFQLNVAGQPFSFQQNYFIDADNDTGTGFAVGGAGHVGSEMLVQAGSGFQEKNGGFNEGGINGLDWLASPSGSGTDFELRISRNATYASDGLPVFTDDTIAFVLQSDVGGEFAPDNGGVVYTFATIPEPSGASLLLVAFAAVGLRRKR